MTYVYVEILEQSVDIDDWRHARGALLESCRLLDLPEPVVRWYVEERVAGRHVLTKYGRRLDKPDDRSLHGWTITDPEHIAIRADQPRAQIAATVAHEMRHVYQERQGRPISEDDAEAFAGRVLANLSKGEQSL